MEYIQVTNENLEQEHICCALSNGKDPQVLAKKEWLREQFAEGLVFRKGNVRGKCFIEYIPAESAWVPLEAEGYLHINCFWVSGSCKGHGYADDLLEACIDDAKAQGRKGLTVISSQKKRPFLSDAGYLKRRGFRLADEAEPYFTLLYLPFSEEAETPRFREHAKHPAVREPGFVLYYTHGCPFTAKYVPILEQAAARQGIPFTATRIASREEAQNAPAVWTNYALFYEGAYVTNEILSEKKFLALYEERKETRK